MRGQEWHQNLYQKFDRKTDYAKAVVNLHNKRVLLALDHVSKSTLLLCTINKNVYLSKYYLQFSVSKYPFIFHSANTAIVPVYTMIRPVLVLISPIGLSSLYNAVIDKRDGNA